MEQKAQKMKNIFDDVEMSYAAQELLMRAALSEARSGLHAGHGGPFGACVVQGTRIMASAHNTVLLDNDPTAHAEINAIRLACRLASNHNLSGCILVCTSEPCPMCLAAIYWARLSGLIFGAGMAVAARHGFDDAVFQAELMRPVSERHLPSKSGVLAAECELLFTNWQASNGRTY